MNQPTSNSADEVHWLGPLADYAAYSQKKAPLDLEQQWASSGALSLTGTPDIPLLCPPEILDRMQSIGQALHAATLSCARPLSISPLHAMVERAACTGQSRKGAISCGGHTRLLRAADGWIAVSLTRSEDFDAVPAWLHQFAPVSINRVGDLWQQIVPAVETASKSAVVSAAQLLGLAVAALGEVPANPWPARFTASTRTSRSRSLEEIVVVDLSSLWAGPLCAHLLAEGGATVIKVESRRRPDGARFGDSRFFDLLNGSAQSVALDLDRTDERAVLAKLLRRADVVIEGSRPRALEAWGMAPEQVMASWGTKAWVSVTGYGRVGPARTRVGYGDDAAVAGGLVAWHNETPNFVLDAVADPLAGLVAAVAVAAALQSDRSWLLDVSLAGVAAWANGGHLGEWQPAGSRPELRVVAPRVGEVASPAPQLGADNDAVLQAHSLPSLAHAATP
jgi:CoA-transferase family III